ncbi:MAG: sigma 54-interacting transcriptional regulator [Bacteroidetes bacterium]|nr:sigma 54-interacting transcriptional regulator [Bacteroidota bacterium]
MRTVFGFFPLVTAWIFIPAFFVYEKVTAIEPVIPVVITREAVEELGGWPLDRKFYGLLISRLNSNGPVHILFDFSFAEPDLLHPESDDYLKWTIDRYRHIQTLQSPDSAWIAGDGPFILPFSQQFTIEDNWLVTDQNRLTAFPHIDHTFLPDGKIVVTIPVAAELTPPVDAMSIIRGEEMPTGTLFFIYLNHPGITSYVVHPVTNDILPTGAVYATAINTILEERWLHQIPVLALIILMVMAAGAPWLGYLRGRVWLGVGVSLIPAGLLLLLFFQPYFIPAWFYLYLISPVAVSVMMLGRIYQTRQEPPVVPVAGPDPGQVAESRELEDLRYRVQFYENASNQGSGPADSDSDPDQPFLMDAQSPLKRILVKAAQLATADLPVIIYGESGTGKELMAGYIHRKSHRSKGPFIAVNCGALNENLLESELFGNEKGAYTGAVQSRAGRFELATGGTLFLDEIAETSPAFQVKLLRVLQEGVIERVGGTQLIPVSVRIVAATHRNLQEKVAQGSFREDLFYRLNGMTINIPPLRERQADIAAIFKGTLAQKAPELKFADVLLKELARHPWKGNVRELLAATDRAIFNARLKDRAFLIPEDFELPLLISDSRPDQRADQLLTEFRRLGFRHRMMSEAAVNLGMHRTTVTEFFRGWVLRLSRPSRTPDEVVALLAGNQNGFDRTQLNERVKEYMDGINERVDEGIREGETNQQILSGKFRNLPSVFHEDLFWWIDHRRSVS